MVKAVLTDAHAVLRYTKYIVIALAVVTVPTELYVGQDGTLTVALLYAAQTVLSELETAA